MQPQTGLRDWRASRGVLLEICRDLDGAALQRVFRALLEAVRDVGVRVVVRACEH
jgi:hypothetical protein